MKSTILLYVFLTIVCSEEIYLPGFHQSAWFTQVQEIAKSYDQFKSTYTNPSLPPNDTRIIFNENIKSTFLDEIIFTHYSFGIDCLEFEKIRIIIVDDGRKRASRCLKNIIDHEERTNNYEVGYINSIENMNEEEIHQLGRLFELGKYVNRIRWHQILFLANMIHQEQAERKDQTHLVIFRSTTDSLTLKQNELLKYCIRNGIQYNIAKHSKLDMNEIEQKIKIAFLKKCLDRFIQTTKINSKSNCLKH